MPRGPKGEKHLANMIGTAVYLMQIARGSMPNSGKDKAALGSKARAKGLSKKRWAERFGGAKERLQSMSRPEREEHARKAGKMILYFPDEAKECRRVAEAAVMKAAPPGFALSVLNGLNIGAGGRRVSCYLTPLDLKRKHAWGEQLGSLLSPMLPLPFRPDSIDYIVSLHSLEHAPNPIEVIDHWLTIIKPGGGIGLILPDWRYCWDARKDGAVWGHKWNTEPDVLAKMHQQHWAETTSLEALETYDFKISFDVVLRKHGVFEPFNEGLYLSGDSGAQANREGRFVSDRYP